MDRFHLGDVERIAVRIGEESERQSLVFDHRAGKPGGGSLDDSASAEAVVVAANGLVVTAGVAGPPPHELGHESNSAKSPDAHLVIPDRSHVFTLDTTLGVDNGQLLTPDAATGGADDAFTLWLQR